MSELQYDNIAKKIIGYAKGMIYVSTYIIVFASVFAAGALWGKSESGRVRPSWRVKEAPCRVSCIRGTDDYILTGVPSAVSNRLVAAVAAYSSTNRLPCGVIFNDGKKMSVLIDARGAVNRSRVDLYLIIGDKAAQPSASVIKEATALHGVVGRTAGMDYPRTRQEIDSLTTRFDRTLKNFKISAFDKIGETYKDWYRGDWRRKSHLVDLNTWILVPADGRFVFGVAGVSPAWLTVDKEDVLAHPLYQPYDKWSVSDAFELKAGLHQVEVRTLCRQKIDTGVAWSREGADGIAKDVVMITGVEMTEGRMEWCDRMVQPFCTVTSGEAYRFAGVDPCFVPFSFSSRSVCWSGKYNQVWNVVDKAVGTGDKIEKTVASVNLPAKVSLTITAVEDGENAQYTTVASYDGPIWSEYEISSRMTGVPAACYGDDKIHPIIRVKSSAKDGLVYTLNSKVELISGKTISRVDAMVTDQGWGRQYLAEIAAGHVKRISWSLMHCGCELSAGQVIFQQDPFRVVPDGISGELFKKGDDFLVLVVSRRSAEREIVADPDTAVAEKVLFMDGFIYDGFSTLGLCSEDQMEYGWQWLSLSGLELSTQRSGRSVLQSFTKVKDALSADVVVYAPSLNCISREGGPEGFERRLAAMCGLMTHAGENSPRVILVVPPHYATLTKSATAEKTDVDSRQVAEIVVRVADVYGVETVDLYTAFEIVGNIAADGSPLVESGEITEAGRAFVRSIIMRKL